MLRKEENEFESSLGYTVSSNKQKQQHKQANKKDLGYTDWLY